MKVVTRRFILLVLALPVVYGLVLYMLGASSGLSVLYSAVTLSFMAGVPYAVGFLTVLPLHHPGWVTRIVAPWLIFAVILLICWLVGWEGSVCIVIASPWLMAFSSLGGVTAGIVKDSRRKQQLGTLVAIAPLFAIPIENQIPTREEMRTHTVAVEISAPPHAVWEYVVQVDTIQAAERKWSLYGVVGFPAPVAATLDHPRLGGVRLASFERGVVFTETITEWMNGERLHFTIEPNTRDIPRTALDPHVTVGGAYFDVLTGTYELEPVGDTATRLTLRSEYRVSTHLNRYSGWWADRIMRSVQRDILRILKARAESDSTAVKLTADMRAIEPSLLAQARAAYAGDASSVGVGAIMTGADTLEISIDASRARAIGTATNLGVTEPRDSGEVLRFRFEDRIGRCIAGERSVRLTPRDSITFGPATLRTCDVRLLADAIRRGRRVARYPFHMQGLDIIFTTVGDYPGTVDVYDDSLVVTVRGGTVRTKLLEGRTQRVDSITAALGSRSAQSWSTGPQSNAFVTYWQAKEGESHEVPRLRFTVPRPDSDALTNRWIVFTHHLTVPKTAENPYGTAWTYAHLSDSMFKALEPRGGSRGGESRQPD